MGVICTLMLVAISGLIIYCRSLKQDLHIRDLSHSVSMGNMCEKTQASPYVLFDENGNKWLKAQSMNGLFYYIPDYQK